PGPPLGRQLAALRHDERAHLGRHVLEELDRDLVAADALDRVQLDPAPVDAHLVLRPELIGDVGRRDRAEERAGRAGLHVEAQLDLAEPLADRLRILERLRLVPGAPLLDLARLDDAGRSRLVGEPARQQEVARVSARDVHNLAAEADLVDVLAEDDLHLAAVRDVGQQRHLTCTLDCDRDLALVPPARAGDAPRADLALLRDVAPQLVRVLVVDLGDLLLAEVTAALADRPGCAGTLAPRLPVAV